MEKIDRKLTDDINNYDIEMILEEDEIKNNDKDFNYDLFELDNKNILEKSKITNNINIESEKYDILKSSNIPNMNYLLNMDLNFIHNNHENINIKNNLNDEFYENKISDEIIIINNENEDFEGKEKIDDPDFSFNENDLYEICDSKNLKTKIMTCELLNFIEVFIHSVLYLRKVYPQEAFKNYIIYNLNLKIITEPRIVEYISEFLNSLESLIVNNLVKRITINIYEPERNKLLEYFSVNIEINEFYNNLIYSDICLHLKTVLNKIYLDYANKKEISSNLNKSFYLSIETRDSKIFCSSNFKTFKNLNKKIEENFVIELLNNFEPNLILNKEICIAMEHVNFCITISRNYI